MYFVWRYIANYYNDYYWNDYELKAPPCYKDTHEIDICIRAMVAFKGRHIKMNKPALYSIV